MSKLTENLGLEKTPVEVKSALAIVMAIEWGWAALAPYFMIALEVEESEKQDVLNTVGIAARSHLETIINTM